jgi:arylsulfatase A-like enzyme/Flp pilus assembly protein TadD
LRAAAVAAAGLVVIVGLAACGRRPRPDELSVVLVTLDTTRADRIGAFGGIAVPTPVLDRLARDGTIAVDATSQVPLTLPAHGSILTGRYPASHGVRHNGIYRLSGHEESIAERLHGAGFDTAAFVAAYVLNRGFGTEQGFDTYDDVDVNRFEGGRDQVFEAQRTADEVNARVFPWLDAHKGRRVFVWVHYYDPHEPYAPPETPGRTLAGEGYEREISYLDACLGDLVAKLRSTGLLDRALLVIVGDHGESLGEHGETTHGLLLYRGALHVPLILRAPGTVPAGRSIAGPVELVDLAPTIVDYLGLPPLARAQGTSLRARIDGVDDGRGKLAHAETLMPRLEFGWSDLRMVEDARFKYIRAPRPELYDLSRDPGESHDLATTDGERSAEMAGWLDAWVAATTDPSAEAASQRALTSEEEARLRSLGYLGGEARSSGVTGAGLTDPKDGIREVRALDAARDKLAAGDVKGALADLEPILRENPKNHQARTTKILALIQAPDLRGAEGEALQALAVSQSDADASTVLAGKARGLLASVYRLEGKNREAERQYRILIAADPGNESAAVDLARLLVEGGRFEEAAAMIGGVLERDPRNGMALAARFQLAAAQGSVAERLGAAGALADARAGDPPTLSDAAAILMGAGDPARAAACYEVILEQAPQPDPELLGKLGIARLRAGDLDGAAGAFAECAALRPSDPRPVYYEGLIAEKRGDTAGARAAFAKALALDPSFAKAAEALRGIDARKP